MPMFDMRDMGMIGFAYSFETGNLDNPGRPVYVSACRSDPV